MVEEVSFSEIKNRLRKSFLELQNLNKDFKEKYGERAFNGRLMSTNAFNIQRKHLLAEYRHWLRMYESKLNHSIKR